MISLIVFYLHIVGFIFGITDQYQREGWNAAGLTAGFMILIFSVGWSIATMVLKIVIDERGFGKGFERDALSLLILTICEAVFYYYYFKRTQTPSAISTGN